MMDEITKDITLAMREPDRPRKRVTVEIDEDLLRHLKFSAREAGWSISAEAELRLWNAMAFCDELHFGDACRKELAQREAAYLKKTVAP